MLFFSGHPLDPLFSFHNTQVVPMVYLCVLHWKILSPVHCSGTQDILKKMTWVFLSLVPYLSFTSSYTWFIPQQERTIPSIYPVKSKDIPCENVFKSIRSKAICDISPFVPVLGTVYLWYIFGISGIFKVYTSHHVEYLWLIQGNPYS